MLLELKNIYASFAASNNDVTNVLNGVSLAIETGKVTALIGGNGSGKTTLFNIISGLNKDYKGQVFFSGNNIDGWAPYKIARNGVGRLFQGQQLMPTLSILDNLKMASKDMTGESPFASFFLASRVRKSEEEKRLKAINILETLFGENNKYLSMLNNPASMLSLGEQRLIALAGLLMNDDKLLLLDEPTAGVNPMYFSPIKMILRDMIEKHGCTVLLIEHNMHFVRDVADRCAYLDDGVIRKYGNVNIILDDVEVRNSYLGV